MRGPPHLVVFLIDLKKGQGGLREARRWPLAAIPPCPAGLDVMMMMTHPNFCKKNRVPGMPPTSRVGGSGVTISHPKFSSGNS